jgi:hypothetical protein
LLDFNFISWHVQHCPRSCNKVAHELAALGNVSDPNEDHVLASLPANIIYVLAEDSALFE